MQIAQDNHKNANETAAFDAPLATRDHPRHAWLPWLLAIISGGLQVVIFPIPNWNFLCWIALAPLLIALLDAAKRSAGRAIPALVRGFLLGWIAGIIVYAGSCYWVYHVMKY